MLFVNASVCKRFSVWKLAVCVCVQVCCVQKFAVCKSLLCVKGSVCKRFFVWKLAVCKSFRCEIFSVKSVGVACFGVGIRFWSRLWAREKVRWFESALRWGETSWQDLRSAEEMWEELRRCERRREEMRRHKMSWQELRRAEKSWDELWKSEKSWDKPRWDEKRWEKLRWHEKRWEQLWSAEKSWERERRHEMGLDEMRWKKPRRHLMSWDELRWWDEMGWHRLRWQWDAVSNFQEKLRWDEIRWDETRFNIQESWHEIDKSRDCCCEAQEACLSPIGTAFASFYSLQVFKIWNFHPQLARVLLGYDAKIQKNHQTGESQGCLFVKETLQTRRQGSGAWDSWLVLCTEAHQACCYSNPNPTRR